MFIIAFVAKCVIFAENDDGLPEVLWRKIHVTGNFRFPYECRLKTNFLLRLYRSLTLFPSKKLISF